VYSMVFTYSALGVAALIRTTDHSLGDARRYLDAGAAGLLVPHVADAAEAEAVFPHLLHPPRGDRGMGFASRAGRWGTLEGGRDEYRRFGEEEVVRVAMIEDLRAVEGIDAILKTDGLDACFVGPSDMALSMIGRPAEDVAAAVDRAVEASVAAGKPVGTVVKDADDARRRVQQGCSYVVVGNDTGMFVKAVRAAHDPIRAAVARPVS
jgi:2-keto-3-deoxy-L-rhamnonate aldolase RhmA